MIVATLFTSDLAARSALLMLDDVPEAVQLWACQTIADTVACAIAGADEDVVKTIKVLLPETSGDARLIGAKGFRHELDAAQINGIAAHALDFDDCNIEMDGHPSVSLVPALLALADRLDATGSDVLIAYIAGIEAEIRIARLSNPDHVDRGWHPTVTFGVIGAAIACGRLLHLTGEQMAIAIGIAASSAAGLRANSGTMTKPLHAGMANRNGLQAALLAQRGFTANPAALEHRMGYFAAFNGAIPMQPESVLNDWGVDFALIRPGIAIKQYPCCAFIHSAIDAAVKLREQLEPDTDFLNDIIGIDVTLHRRRLRNIDRPKPGSNLDAKFSTQYLTARALLSGTVGFPDFEGSALQDAASNLLAARVRLLPHDQEDLSLGYVRLTMKDGRHYEASASVAMGRGPNNPMTKIEFKRKFDDCTSSVLTAEAATELFNVLMNLPKQGSVRTITNLTQQAQLADTSSGSVFAD